MPRIHLSPNSPAAFFASLALLLFSHPLAQAQKAPDRNAFAQLDLPVEGIPVEAFELSDPDLQIEVWARSPLIFSPVAMDCDAKGRIWATEGIDYNQGRRIEAGQSIIVLEDTDGDGAADSSHVFVTEKDIRHAPLGIAVFDNRIVLSATPSIIVYTDVDRDAVFDPAIDKREVFLTGFQNARHDHTLHAVVGAPSGQWHFSFGNCGADIETKDGRHFLSGCYYGNSEDMGKPSSDGHVYVGGMTMRINPDGTGLTPTGQNMRNPHDMFVSAYGDIFQSDNDDPAHCRSSWVMEHGNMGYADLRDGSRSWEEVAKTWEEPSGWSRDLRFSRSHWRENYPGTCPPGTIYGAGSPTGNLWIEDDTLGLAGTYLVGCMVRKEIMACTPEIRGAAIDMGKHRPFLRLKEGERGRFFLPTDIVLGTDGSLFFSDFYNDTSRRTNQVSGTIYRITRKAPSPAGGKQETPAIDFTTAAGQLAALGSPAVNVRSHAAALLAADPANLDAVNRSLEECEEDDPVLRARHLWILAQLGEAGRDKVVPFLEDENSQLKITAFRSLRHGGDPGWLDHARRLANSEDSDVTVLREVALSLRDVPWEDCLDILPPLFASYDGLDRYYLEALGTASTGKEEAAYRELVAARFGDPATWTKTAKNLAWRLHTPEAIAALDTCIRAQRPPIDEFRHLAMAFASFRDDEERTDRRNRLLALGELPEFSREDYQVTVDEIVRKDLNNLEGELLRTSYLVPKVMGAETEVSSPDEIAALAGDPARGEALSAKCLLCHRIAGAGVAFGPELTLWGASRTIPEIVREITDPDAKLAHGYDKPVRITAGKHVAEGLMTNFSWHAGSLKLKILGGDTRKILFRQSGARVEELKESLMPSASEMGLTDQDLRDVAEYLHTLARNENPLAADEGSGAQDGVDESTGETPPDGTTEGWEILTEEDFVNVNCHDDTWRWEGGHAFCTGKPTGVIRFRDPVENFEMICEWKHTRKGGNSGVFVWATPQSIANLMAGRGRLPQGIEVQVLDPGYDEVYTRQFNKPADWFTGHGDVFPVGGVRMTPFPPVAPDGRRSFPSEDRTKSFGEWNHYFIRANRGEVRLWVNGREVSGGENISPARGYLCLESEGAPVEFRNIRFRPLPSGESPEIDLESLRPPAPKPVTLEGHALLGTWYYGAHSREFRPDGSCILRQGDEIIWTRRCISKTETGLVLEGNLTHQLEGEELNIENRYRARRTKAE